MQDLYTDPGVMIRSMATRGHLGGLSRATADAVDVLDAAGFDDVLVETVGVGQDEVEVFRLAETCVVLLTPGMGDDIQAIKAGLMEVADVFVVNKADRDGADRDGPGDPPDARAGGARRVDPPGPEDGRADGRRASTGCAPSCAKHRDFLAGPDGRRPAAGTGPSGGSRRSSRRGSSPSCTASPAKRGARWPPGRAGSRRGARTRSAPRRRSSRRSGRNGGAGRAEGPAVDARISHLGLAVASVDGGGAFWDLLGLLEEHREEVASQKVITSFRPVGESHLELLEPTVAREPHREVPREEGARASTTSASRWPTSPRCSRS